MTDDTRLRDLGQRSKIIVATIPDKTFYAYSATLTLAAGGAGGVSFLLTPDDNRRTLWTGLRSIYVDGLTAADHFADGANMTGGKLSLRVTAEGFDLTSSSEVSGKKVWGARLENYDSSSHTYTYFFKAYTLAGVTGEVT